MKNPSSALRALVVLALCSPLILAWTPFPTERLYPIMGGRDPAYVRAFLASFRASRIKNSSLSKEVISKYYLYKIKKKITFATFKIISIRTSY